jgi:hypothetical protein
LEGMDGICGYVLWARFVTSPMYLLMLHLIDNVDHSQDTQKDRSRTIKTQIGIINDANGEPEIPSVTSSDGYHAKVIQGALREYCTAHIRE